MSQTEQTDEQKTAAWFKDAIKSSEKELDRWHKRGEKISKAYRDDRGSDGVDGQSDKGLSRRMNLFWANTDTLKPAIYSKMPQPVCERRFLDKDDIGRIASTILERCLRYEVQMSGFDAAVNRAVDDYLKPGRGQVWARYYPILSDPISPDSTADNDMDDGDGQVLNADREHEEEQTTQELLSESLCIDYVHWQDYGTLPAYARTEDEVEGKYRRIYMSRTDLVNKFGEKIGRAIPLDHGPEDSKTHVGQQAQSNVTGKTGMQATIYEIWWKPKRRVYFIAKEYDDLCEEVDDPLKLTDFFPCPPSLNAVMTNDTTIPVPFYAETQDQYFLIDDLTKRIDILTSACKVVGLYDASNVALRRIFEEAVEPNLIPYDQWSSLMEKNGVAGALALIDTKGIAEVLKILIDVRSQMIQDLDRLTGINNIMSGTDDGRETLGGKRLKVNSSATRLQEQQKKVATFCRDIICIMGEIIAEQYTPETLIQVSGAMYDEGLDPPDLPPAPSPMIGHNGGPPMPPTQQVGQTPVTPMPVQLGGVESPLPSPPETPEQKQQRKLAAIMQAIDLLRQDKLRGFRIDIETDSTIEGDAQAEKEARTEFLTAVATFIEKSSEIVAQVPEFAPLAAKMLGFGVRGFRVGRDLESAIDDFCDKVESDAKQKANNPPPPNPEIIKAQTEQFKANAEIKRQEIENQGEQQNAMIDLESKKMDLQMKQIELQIKQLEFHLRNSGSQTDENGQPVVPAAHHLQSAHMIHESAKMFDLASKRNAAPKKVIRGPDGKVSHLVTDFEG